MSIVSYLCFSFSLILILSCLKKGADIFSPVRVYGLTWFIAIGLTDLKFSRYQHEWSTFSWIVMVTGFISFMVGLYLVYVVSLGKNIYEPIAIRKILNESKINEQYFYIAILIVSFFYISSFIVETLIHGELPIFSAIPDDSRKKYGVFGLHLFVTSMPIILFFIVQYFIFVNANRVKKIFLSAIFIFISYFTLLVRFNYIVFIFMTACFVYYTSNLFNTRNMLLATGVIVILFYLSLQIREARYAENFLYVISDLKFSKDYSFFAGPYMYIVMNLENFARVIERIDQFTFGYYSFDFVFALAGLKHPLASYFALEERIFLNSSFNTFPYFYPFYRDFGLMGVFLFPFILGILVGLVHLSVKTKPNLLNISIYSFCVFFMGISFFTNPLTMLNNIFMLFLLVLINKFAISKNG